MWFNKVKVTKVAKTNDWNVYSFETTNGHKVRGISKFEVAKIEVGQEVNVKIDNKYGATYVSYIKLRDEAAA